MVSKIVNDTLASGEVMRTSLLMQDPDRWQFGQYLWAVVWKWQSAPQPAPHATSSRLHSVSLPLTPNPDTIDLFVAEIPRNIAINELRQGITVISGNPMQG